MTKIIAHRGASGYAPENTLPAFELAIAQKSDGIEFDVHLSKDGIPVVCHDEQVDRTTNGLGFIGSYNALELQKLDAGSWYDKSFTGARIPLLGDVLELCSRQNTDFLINIEIKAGSKLYPGIEEIVIQYVEKYKLNKQVIISSFDHYALKKIKEINSGIRTGVLYTASWIAPWEYIKKLNFDALHPAWHTLTPRMIKASHEAGLMINTYTVNDAHFVPQMIYLGVDGIITNFPDRLIKVRDTIIMKN